MHHQAMSGFNWYQLIRSSTQRRLCSVQNFKVYHWVPVTSDSNLQLPCQSIGAGAALLCDLKLSCCDMVIARDCCKSLNTTMTRRYKKKMYGRANQSSYLPKASNIEWCHQCSLLSCEVNFSRLTKTVVWTVMISDLKFEVLQCYAYSGYPGKRRCSRHPELVFVASINQGAVDFLRNHDLKPVKNEDYGNYMKLWQLMKNPSPLHTSTCRTCCHNFLHVKKLTPTRPCEAYAG